MEKQNDPNAETIMAEDMAEQVARKAEEIMRLSNPSAVNDAPVHLKGPGSGINTSAPHAIDSNVGTIAKRTTGTRSKVLHVLGLLAAAGAGFLGGKCVYEDKAETPSQAVSVSAGTSSGNLNPSESDIPKVFSDNGDDYGSNDESTAGLKIPTTPEELSALIDSTGIRLKPEDFPKSTYMSSMYLEHQRGADGSPSLKWTRIGRRVTAREEGILIATKSFTTKVWDNKIKHIDYLKHVGIQPTVIYRDGDIVYHLYLCSPHSNPKARGSSIVTSKPEDPNYYLAIVNIQLAKCGGNTENGEETSENPTE